jgi:hypothetical protein
MRRSFVLAVLAVAAAVGAWVTVDAAAGPSAAEPRSARLHIGRGYFAVPCRFSHRNQDDPIVFPGRPGPSRFQRRRGSSPER